MFVAPLLLLASAFSVQEPEAEYWPAPDAWERVTPEKAGMDATKLEATGDFVLENRSKSFLVLRGGRIVAERYAEGWGAERRLPIYSASKSMTAILVGIALDEGAFEGLDQRVADFHPAWKDGKKAKITLRHLLTMTSGLDPRGLRRRRAGDRFVVNAGQRLSHEPGKHWQYNTPAYHMLFRLLEKATGEPLDVWSKKKLFGPLGMHDTEWMSQKAGEVTNWFRTSCSARDMARFGLFALRGGRWEKEQLVSKAYFAQATSPSQRTNPAYGFLWWLNRVPGANVAGRSRAHRFPGAPKDVMAALGARGQYILAVPSLDLVVVRQGEQPGRRDLHAALLRRVVGAIQKLPEGIDLAPAPKPGADFARFDTNGDGKLSREEFARTPFAARRAGLFGRLDADGDGKLTRAEIAGFLARRRR